MSGYLSEGDYQAYLKKHENWNFWVNVLDLTFYHTATSFIYGATVLSLYASYLTDSAVLIGLIPALQGVMFLLPQMLLARRTQTLPRMKPLLAKISIFERLPYSIVALSIFLLPNAPRGAAYAILLLSLVMATGSGGLIGPAWKAMLAKVVPVRRRGIMFGTSSALGGVLGFGGATVSRYILATYGYPVSFGISFALCFLFQAVSYLCLILNREPARAPEAAPLSAGDYWRRIPGMLRGHPNFVRYLIGNALLTLGTMGTALYIVYARRTFGISDAMAGNLTMAALLGQSLSAPIMGRLADRRGNKWLLQSAGLISGAAIMTVAFAPSAIWLYPAFMLVNVAAQASSISGMGITMEFSSQDEIPTFTALAGTISGVPMLLAPLVGGSLVDAGGFGLLFGVALTLALAGFAMMRLAVKEPRHEERRASTLPAGATGGDQG
jgi:MFS family permease